MEQLLVAAIYILIFTYGIVIGSFLNVCIYRIPKKESIIFPSSHCMECGHKLSWYDLFPLFSFLLLKGRCRYCGTKISKQYPVVEAVNGILYVIVFMANGLNAKSILYCLMTSALLVITVIDERTFEIPVSLNCFLAILGVFMCFLDYRNLLEHIIGAVCVSLFLELLLLLTGGSAIGGGDVKLMAVAGLILGWKLIILAFFSACIIGSVVHVLRMKITKANRVLAMGPYLSLGIFLMALWGDRLISWYLGMLLY
ncbi:MAG: prepilin peptidase [Agathobacter sp.]